MAASKSACGLEIGTPVCGSSNSGESYGSCPGTALALREAAGLLQISGCAGKARVSKSQVTQPCRLSPSAMEV